MWNSVLQFKLIFCLLILPALADEKAGSVLMQDKAVFRVYEQVYFVTDINKLQSEIKQFRCLIPNSLVFKLTGLDSRKSFERLETTSESLEKNHQDINTMVKLVKIFRYTGKQPVTVTNDFMAKLRIGHCLGSNRTAMNALQKYIRSEVYLLDRFKGISGGKNINNKINESIDSFINTIYKRTEHKLLYGSEVL